jgi:uncharacterized DUF497 family protein
MVSPGMRARIASTGGNTASSFESAARIFEDPNVISYVDRIVEDEERWHAVGGAGGIALLLVVHAVEEGHDEEEIRIISARKANPRERALYESPH